MRVKIWRRTAAVCVFGSVFLTAMGTAPADGAELRQVNPVRQAPSQINNGGGYDNEYPWFSKDGKLMLWTRQGSDGNQWLWATYIKNRSAIAAKAAGQTLPALSVSPPYKLHDVNHWVIDNIPGTHIKAFSVCEEPSPVQPTNTGSHWRYRMTLYLAIGPQSGTKVMYRAHRVVIKVRKSDSRVTSSKIPNGMQHVIPQTTPPSGGIANETEPMVTRNGKYLFWASNAFNASGTYAKYISTGAACGMANQSPRLYGQLPPSLFRWKDQYSTGFTHERTDKTNYHTVVERPNGRTALIFERCSGQTNCNPSQAGNRDCECDAQNNKLSTTGFEYNGEPTLIANCCGGNALNRNGVRVSHPAISGPRNPDRSWLLFFMRGKKIWYTKIKE